MSADKKPRPASSGVGKVFTSKDDIARNRFSREVFWGLGEIVRIEFLGVVASDGIDSVSVEESEHTRCTGSIKFPQIKALTVRQIPKFDGCEFCNPRPKFDAEGRRSRFMDNPKSRIAWSFIPASWYATQPLDAETNRIPFVIQTESGAILRVALDKESAISLMETLREPIRGDHPKGPAHPSRVRSER